MKRIPIWKNILLIFSLIVTIVIATFSWFFTEPRAAMDELPVAVGQAAYVEISSDNGSNWAEGVEIELGLIKNFREISGNGTVFYQPVYEVIENDQGAMGSVITSFNRAADEECSFEQTFNLRSDTTQDIYLSPESYIVAVGDSVDTCIAGAVRVAFFEVDNNGNETLKCIWAPNSTIEYLQSDNTFTNTGKVESNYYIQKTNKFVDTSTLSGTGDSNVTVISTRSGVSANCANCGYNSANKYMWTCGEHMPTNAPVLARVAVPEGETLGYTNIKIKVWIEGHDRECVTLAYGQRFTMNLQFSTTKGE